VPEGDRRQADQQKEDEREFEPPVAQPFATLMKGRPVSPRRLTIVSALPAL
jgi:hypothetical protein